MKRPIALFTIIILVATQLWAQKTTYSSLRDALFSARNLSGGSAPANLTWIRDGGQYSFTKRNNGAQEIWTHDVKSNQEIRVFTTADFNFPDDSIPFQYRTFTWTSDYQSLLFQTNFRPVWRYSGNADYYLYSLRDRSLKLVVKSAFTAEISPDGTMLGYGKDGNLFVYALATGESTQLTNDAEDYFYNGRFGWAYEEEFGLVQAWSWSPDSRYMAFWQSDEREVPIYKLTDFSGQHPEYMEIPYPKVGDSAPLVKIGVIDLLEGTKSWLDIELHDGYIPRIYWTSREHTLAVISMNRPQNHMKLHFFNVAEGTHQRIMEEQNETWIDIFDFFQGRLHHFYFPEDLDEFFWISDRDGWSHIYRYDYTGELLNQVTSGPWEVTGIDAIDTRKERLYYISSESSPLERHLYSIKFDGSRKQRLTSFEGHHALNVAPGGAFFIDSYTNVNTPRQVDLVNSKGKVIKKLSDNQSTIAFIDTHYYAPRELFSFTTSDGQELDGFIIRPMDFDPEKSYPLLLDIYGGPGSQSVYNTFETNGWHQYLAQNGYVIAGVNNRGNGGYGGAFERVVYGNLGHWEALDFVETAKYLASEPWVDTDRMAIRGHSYGGFMSGYTMLKHPGVFKVALVAAPVTDHRLYDCIYTERYMGLIDNEEGYTSSSVHTYAKNLEGHLFLAHSLMDENVHPQNTFHLVSALIDQGKDFDLKIFPSGAHGVAYNMASYLLLMTQYTNYLDAHLKK
jgi:dipeptidyl-peptidase-4